MFDINLEPKMVGRENELKDLLAYLDRAAEGQGSTIFISGEAGIGKTRLVNELKQIAQSQDFQILTGNCMYESLTPFMPIMEALRSGGLESLFTEEAPRVEAVYLVTNTGILIKEVVREETELNPDVFVSMFTTVTDFLNESLSKLSGEEEKGTLNSLGYQNYRILIEGRRNTNLVVILTGRENEFLLNDMREILLKITRTFKKTLKEWGGDEKKVVGIEELLKPLITSGKYDGIYYGKDDPKIRRNLLFENVSLGLTRCAKTSPTLLCIEDLQWVDPSSLALMHYLSKITKESALLILGTYRPEDVSAEVGKGHSLVNTMQLMNREDLFEKMNLERLPQESITEVLSSLLGEIDFTENFISRIYKETEGNPLFVIQLVKFLVDENIIKTDNGTWRLEKDTKDIEIPSKIYYVIEKRLDRLEKEDRKVLDYASVIGEIFESSILAASLNSDKVQLLEHLRGLEKTHRLINSHDRNFKFDHAKIKEVLYSEIPKELRSEYHCIIAQSIEKLNIDNVDNVIGDLAFHYFQCNNKEKALLYLDKAAEKAKKDYSNEEAIRFYNDAIELEEDTFKRREIFENKGDIYKLIGDYDNSIKSYESALEMTDEMNKIAEIKIKIGENHERKGEYSESLKICSEALELVRDKGCKEEAMALIIIGYVHESRGQYDKGLAHFKNSLKICEKIGDQQYILRAFGNIGTVYNLLGIHENALKNLKTAQKIGEKIGSLYANGITFNNIGFVYHLMGEYDKSLISYRKSLKLEEKIGDQLGIGRCHLNIGFSHYYMDECDIALHHLEKSLKILKKISAKRELTYCYCRSALVYLKMEDLQKALEFCQQAFDLSSEIGYQHNIATSKMVYGMIYKEEKRWKESIENFLESIKIFNEIGLKNELAESHFEFALMWKSKGDVDKAKEHMNQAIDIFKNLNSKKWVEKVNGELLTMKT